MKKFIPLCVPKLKGNELKYVSEAIETEWVSTVGSYVKKFEDNIAEYVNAEGAVACQSGTAGLHIALEICGVTQGHEVIVPTLTFIAAVNPVKYVGAEPVFMDCDDSLTIDVSKLKEFIKNECEFVDNKLINKSTKKHIKAIIPVHIFGNISDMECIMQLAADYNLFVIEDATEAIGSYYKTGKYKGKFAGTIGHIGVYSFNGNKIITTGGGGMIVSDNQEFLDKAKHLTTQAKSDELYYIHDEIGYNYRMTNVQAAIGVAQLEQLENFIKIKQDNFDTYRNIIKEVDGITLLEYDNNIRCNYWFYALVLADDYGMKRDEVISYLKANKIQTRPIWGLIHDQKPYLNNQSYKIEKARFYHDRVVNLPCSTNLTNEDIVNIMNVLCTGK